MGELSIKQKWVEGYECGLSWPDAWDGHPEPGGPFVSHTKYASQSAAENRAWREGWRKGHFEKLRKRKEA